MAEAEEDKRLPDIFLDGWKGLEELEVTSLPYNSAQFQDKVKAAMERFETSTRIVSEIGMFSANEMIEEVSTESLRYLLLPFFLGKLALKLSALQQRTEALNVAEIYLKDYLKRCHEYELSDAPATAKSGELEKAEPQNSDELKDLMRAAHSRNDKIARYRQKKELEEYIAQMRVAVQNDAVDEEVKREFFMKFLRKAIIDAQEELSSLQMERQMLEMRKMHMSGDSVAALERNEGPQSTHGHSHTHGAVPRPLQPFIITRNATQKAVFGMGYPSLPVLSVDEFYSQRVRDGIFPDEEKVAKMNAAQAIAAAQDPNEKEDQEQAVEEVQVERDDEEYLARMRRMDEYKDVVRRGDGNRHNRS